METQDVTIAYGTSATVTQALSTPLIAGTYKVNMFVTVQGTAASNSETANFNAGAYLLTLDSCGTGCDQNLSPSPAVYAEAVGSSVPIAFTGTPSQWAISCWIVISYSPNQYIHNICNSGSTSVGPASFSLAMDSSKEVIPQIAPASTFGFINITPDLASETPIGIGVFQPNTAQSVYASGLTCSNGSACPTTATFSVSNGNGIFQGWSIKGTSLSGKSFPFTITHDELIAAGIKDGSSVSLEGSWTVPIGGTTGLTLQIVGQPNVNLFPAPGTYSEGLNANVTITGTPSSGYCIVNWSVNNANLFATNQANSNKIVIEMKDNTQVTPIVAKCGSQSTSQRYGTYTMAGLGAVLALIGLVLPSRKAASRV